MSKYIEVKLTEDQANELCRHLISLHDFELDDKHKAFLTRILVKINKAFTASLNQD